MSSAGKFRDREGDYLGTSVNVAARLAAEAQRHQVLVTATVRTETGSLPDVEFVPLGKRRLRGLSDELELFEIVPRAEGQRAPRPVDPVCGMELGAGEVAARLSMQGKEHVFCSQRCLQRFVAAPVAQLSTGARRCVPARSESLFRGAVGGSPARTDLWEPGTGSRLGPPGDVGWPRLGLNSVVPQGRLDSRRQVVHLVGMAVQDVPPKPRQLVVADAFRKHDGAQAMEAGDEEAVGTRKTRAVMAARRRTENVGTGTSHERRRRPP